MPAPKKVWELKGLDAPESVVFDPASNALYVSNIGGKIWQKDDNGFIAKVSPDGKMIEHQWLTGLSSPTGLALEGGKLHVADIDQLVEIDIASKSVTKRYFAGREMFQRCRERRQRRRLCRRLGDQHHLAPEERKVRGVAHRRSAQRAERTLRRGRYPACRALRRHARKRQGREAGDTA